MTHTGSFFGIFFNAACVTSGYFMSEFCDDLLYFAKCFRNYNLQSHVKITGSDVYFVWTTTLTVMFVYIPCLRRGLITNPLLVTGSSWENCFFNLSTTKQTWQNIFKMSNHF